MGSGGKGQLRAGERERAIRVWERLFEPRWKIGWDAFEAIGIFRRHRKRQPLPICRNSSVVHFVLSGSACFVHEGEPMTFANSRKDAILTSLVGQGHIILHHFLPYDIDTFRFYAFTDCIVADVELDDFCSVFFGTTAEKLGPLIDEISYPSAFATYRYNHAWIGEQRTRLAAALLELGMQLGVREDQGTVIPFQITQEDLSNMIGGHRTSIPGLLRQLMAERALWRQGGHFVIDEDNLRIILKSNSRNARLPAGDQSASSLCGLERPFRITHRLA